MRRLSAALFVLALILLMTANAACAEPKRCPYKLSQRSIHYRCMTSAQRKLFDEAYDAVRNQDATVAVAGLTTDETYLIFDTLFNECAELCSLSAWKVYGRDINGVWTPTHVSLTYKRSVAVQDSFIREIAALCKRFSSVHDIYAYLCQRLQYGDVSAHPEHMYAYDALQCGKAVCNGYAQCMAMMCHFAGLECSYIDGMTNPGCHAWNIVGINGKYTLLDVTWDDTGNTPGYRWFALSDKEMNGSHTPDPEYRVLSACVNLQGSVRIGQSKTASFDYNNLCFSLKLKDSGKPVVRINKRLIELGYLSGSSNHAYNNATKKAVAAFQAKNGIQAGNSASSGVCTRLTQAALFAPGALSSRETAKKTTIRSKPFDVCVGSHYGFQRSGSGGKMTFTLHNKDSNKAITALTLRYWATNAKGKVVYTAREQGWTDVNLGPGEYREMTYGIAEDSGIRNAVEFHWAVIEVGFENGEVFIDNVLSGKDAYTIATHNEKIR